MRRVVALVMLIGLMCVPGCKKYYKLNYRTGRDLNVSEGSVGQPVLVGLYALTRLPPDLTTMTCDALSSDQASKDALKDVLARELDPVSFVPDERSLVKLPRIRSARWLMVVPFYEDKCARKTDDWALLRLLPTTRNRSVSMRSFTIELPWEARPWRQRGCVDGRASHFSSSICE